MSLHALANHMSSRGRGEDSMLVHMTPGEVHGLQALAMKHGGSLTINPDTGLPEAGFLSSILPMLAGFALNAFAPGLGTAVGSALGASAATAGAIGTGALVGGITGLATGSLSKGLMAGLGAYGGAGLGEGLLGAGAASGAGQALSVEAAKQAALEGITLPADYASLAAKTAMPEQIAAARAAATPGDLLAAGAKSAAADPMAFAKANWKPIAAASLPVLGEIATTTPGQTASPISPGRIREKRWDGRQFVDVASTDAGVYNTSGRNFSDLYRGYNTGGIVALAEGGGMPRNEGGITSLAAGGDAALAAYQSGNYGEASRLLAEAGMSAQDVVSKYGLSQADAATVAKNLGYAGDMSGLQYAAPPVAQAAAPVVQAAAAPVVQAAAAAPTYTQYTPEQMGSYLTTNKDINIQDAIKATNADPAAVNAYIASLTSPFVGSTLDTRGSGTLGIYNNMVAQGVDPDEYYKSALANDPKYAGWSLADIKRGYKLDEGAYALSKKLSGNVSDKDWVKFMDEGGYSVNDMAQAFGLSTREVQARYDAAKTKTTPITCPAGFQLNAAGTACEPITVVKPPPLPPPTTIIPGVNDYGLGGTGTSGRLESIYGPAIPPGVSGAGITTVNPNGTITTRPNIPGIPEGGFTGMANLRDVYEKGGGSLGVNKNLFVPKTQDELFARYKNTGGSKAALDYLMGKIPYSPVPVTPTGEIMKPYWESVGKIPAQEKNRNKKYVFVNGKYELNPDYVKPSYVQAGEKAAALTNQDKEPTESPGAGNKWTWNSVDKKWEAKPIGGDNAATNSENDRIQGGGEANGGLMAGGGLAALTMAGGGMSGQFDLGGYSDGGRLLRGPGDGVSDSIPATIGNKRPARLADGEFVIPARIVSELGNGSTEAGARKLYAMMDRVQAARKGSIGKGKVAKNSRADKYLPA